MGAVADPETPETPVTPETPETVATHVTEMTEIVTRTIVGAAGVVVHPTTDEEVVHRTTDATPDEEVTPGTRVSATKS
jgi:hypothetical protein